MVIDKASDDDFARVNAVLEDLTARAHNQLDADRIPIAQRRFRQIAECRYVGQGFELRAEIPLGPLTRDSAAVVVDHFYDAHKQVYGHAFRDQSCEIVTLRVVATVAVDTLTLPKLQRGGRKIRRTRCSTRDGPCLMMERRSRRRATSGSDCLPTTSSKGRR